jgi:hypothetical protein
MLYRCSVRHGTYAASDETSSCRWVTTDQLPALLPNQVHLLRKAKVL